MPMEKPPAAERTPGPIAVFSNSYARLPEHFFGLCHIAARRVAKIRASWNNQTAATAVRHVSIAAARST
jgi:hypothetical protein